MKCLCIFLNFLFLPYSLSSKSFYSRTCRQTLFLSNYLIFHNLDIITPLLTDIWVVSSLGLFEPHDMVVGSRGFGLPETWNWILEQLSDHGGAPWPHWALHSLSVKWEPHRIKFSMTSSERDEWSVWYIGSAQKWQNLLFFLTRPQLLFALLLWFILSLLIQLVNSLLKPIHPEMPSKSFRESRPNDGVSHVQRLETLSRHELTQLQGTHRETGAHGAKADLVWTTSHRGIPLWLCW